MGDSIRKTNAFTNDKSYMEAFNKWSGTKAGKRFLKDYGDGGKYEHVAVVFDVGELQNSWANAETGGEIVGPDGAMSLEGFAGKPENVIKGARDLVNGKGGNSYLRYTVTFNSNHTQDQYSTNPKLLADDALTHVHESQHIRLSMMFLQKYQTQPTSSWQHSAMKISTTSYVYYNNKPILVQPTYYRERADAFWELSRLWAPDYVKRRDDYNVKRNPFWYVNLEINNFQY